jgi:sporulation protein YlmC with PRC-barrel domain
MENQPREIDAVQDLADLAILDRDKRPVGRVDDLDFDDANPPVMRAMLSGAPALSRRIGGRLGAWMRGIYGRLHDDKDPEPLRITFEQVAHINSRVDLSVTRDDLGIGKLDRWLVDVIIGKIPGADHAPE